MNATTKRRKSSSRSSSSSRRRRRYGVMDNGILINKFCVDCYGRTICPGGYVDEQRKREKEEEREKEKEK